MLATSEALDSRRAQCARDRGARQCSHTRAGRLNSGSLSRSELTVVFWFGTGSGPRSRLYGGRGLPGAHPGRSLLGHHGPGVWARPSRFLHQPPGASGLDNLIQTHTTPAERGCTLVALAYILDGVHLRPQPPLLEQACTHTRARAHTHAHTPCGRIRKDSCLRMSVHCTARMTDSEHLSRPPATTSYPSTYYPLGVERLFTRQLQPPKVCGPQALPRAAARPEQVAR